jgi:hypothetical protein
MPRPEIVTMSLSALSLRQPEGHFKFDYTQLKLVFSERVADQHVLFASSE